MQLPGELDERCRAGAPGKQAFGAKATAERPRGEVTARVPAGEQPPFRMRGRGEPRGDGDRCRKESSARRDLTDAEHFYDL